MKKTILTLVLIMTALSAWSFSIENTLSFQLPSNLDADNTGILYDQLNLSAEFNDMYTAEIELPLNLIVNSRTVFYFGNPQIGAGIILGRNKKTNHSFNLAYGIPVDVSEEASKYVGKLDFHSLAVSYRVGIVSDPVVFYAGVQIQTKFKDWPSVLLSTDLLFSINRTFSVKASTGLKAEYADKKMSYNLTAGCECIVDFKIFFF